MSISWTCSDAPFPLSTAPASFKEAERLKAELAAAGGERAPPPPAFHLGQLVCEQGRGYTGVVAGWEQVCGEGPAWLAAAGHDRAGAPGPWYFLLVEEVAGRGPRSGLPPVALVPEGALEPAGDPSLVPGGAHPLLSLLFLGKDAEGNHLPCRQLRQRFGAERRDVHPPGGPLAGCLCEVRLDRRGSGWRGRGEKWGR